MSHRPSLILQENVYVLMYKQGHLDWANERGLVEILIHHVMGQSVWLIYIGALSLVEIAHPASCVPIGCYSRARTANHMVRLYISFVISFQRFLGLMATSY